MNGPCTIISRIVDKFYYFNVNFYNLTVMLYVNKIFQNYMDFQNFIHRLRIISRLLSPQISQFLGRRIRFLPKKLFLVPIMGHFPEHTVFIQYNHRWIRNISRNYIWRYVTRKVDIRVTYRLLIWIFSLKFVDFIFKNII